MADESTKLSALIGARSAGPLAKARDLHTVGDLLEFWPRRYLEHSVRPVLACTTACTSWRSRR